MTEIYFIIVAFLLMLAVFDLFVGVSNDAVNFLNSAVGAKVAKYRTILIVASLGVLIGAIMSSGMMDVARHGIMRPENYSFHEVMTIFLAVMVTDVIILDIFNTLGMPTSTTVSLVFELLGGTFILAMLKMSADPTLAISDLLNSDKALSVIIAIFVSVAIAFFFGALVQWISRIIFTFNYRRHLRWSIAIFGGIAFTTLSYFILIKGLGKSPYISAATREWIDVNTAMLMTCTFVVSTVVIEVLHLLHVRIFRLIVLLGTFALAMAFAGNDLVNFIGVPLAGLDSLCDFTANGNGNYDGYMMTSLMTSDEMFGSSRLARSIVRSSRDIGELVVRFTPKSVSRWIDSRFNKDEVILAEGAAFDEVRAAVNLVLAALLIVLGTSLKLPLSTTYVTFMVAMGTSLADRAWSRESAVFRVTGVVSVIGGWFITAGAAFAACAIVCLLMHLGGFVVMLLFMALDIYLLWKSNRNYKRKMKEERNDDLFMLMMRTKDKDIVWDLLSKHVQRTQSFVAHFSIDLFNRIVDGISTENRRELKQCGNALKEEQDQLKKIRRKEMLAMRRIPSATAIERNTWFHIGANCNMQYIYCLKRMQEPLKEHVDNNFNPLPKVYTEGFETMRRKINELMLQTEQMMSTGRYDLYQETLNIADQCKDELSVMRKDVFDRMQHEKLNNLKASLLYLNILQESQEFLSVMRHQLRAAKKFGE